MQETQNDVQPSSHLANLKSQQQNHIVHIINPIATVTTYDSDSGSDTTPVTQLSRLTIRSVVFGAFAACLSRRNRGVPIDKSTHTCESSEDELSGEEDDYLWEDDAYSADHTDGEEEGSEDDGEDRKPSFATDVVEEFQNSSTDEGFDGDTEDIDDSSSNDSHSIPTEEQYTGDDNDAAHHQTEDNVSHNSQHTPSLPTSTLYDKHTRTATSAPHIDLSGSYTILITDEFLLQYDRYLTALGFNYFTRKVALQVIYQTSEVVEQGGVDGDGDGDRGTELRLVGSNPKGVWDRTLTATAEGEGGTTGHRRFCTTTADGEEVLAEAWWEEGGTVHRSILLDAGSKYGGGDFEARRFLEEGGDVYNCVSTFHPKTEDVDPISITWRFRKEVVE